MSHGHSSRSRGGSGGSGRGSVGLVAATKIFANAAIVPPNAEGVGVHFESRPSCRGAFDGSTNASDVRGRDRGQLPGRNSARGTISNGVSNGVASKVLYANSSVLSADPPPPRPTIRRSHRRDHSPQLPPAVTTTRPHSRCITRASNALPRDVHAPVLVPAPYRTPPCRHVQPTDGRADLPSSPRSRSPKRSRRSAPPRRSASCANSSAAALGGWPSSRWFPAGRWRGGLEPTSKV